MFLWLWLILNGSFLRHFGTWGDQFPQSESQRVRSISILDPGGEGRCWRGKWKGCCIWKNLHGSWREEALFPQKDPCLWTFHKALLYSQETPQHEREEELMLTWGMVYIPSSRGFPSGGHVWSPCVNDRHLILTGNVVDFWKSVLQLCAMQYVSKL